MIHDTQNFIKLINITEKHSNISVQQRHDKTNQLTGQYSDILDGTFMKIQHQKM